MIAAERHSDLFELLGGVVVLPAFDLAVFVVVDFDADDAGAVHVAPGVDLAVAVGVVFQELQLPGELVVDRLDVGGLGRATARRRHDQGTAQESTESDVYVGLS